VTDLEDALWYPGVDWEAMPMVQELEKISMSRGGELKGEPLDRVS